MKKFTEGEIRQAEGDSLAPTDETSAPIKTKEVRDGRTPKALPKAHKKLVKKFTSAKGKNRPQT